MAVAGLAGGTSVPWRLNSPATAVGAVAEVDPDESAESERFVDREVAADAETAVGDTELENVTELDKEPGDVDLELDERQSGGSAEEVAENCGTAISFLAVEISLETAWYSF
jgi:hypothetical protein